METRGTAEAEALRDVVATFTDRATGDGDGESLAAAEWALLRALADLRDAVTGPDRPDVLGWVPPVEELDGGDGDPRADTVMQVATWFFTVEDADRVVAAGRGRATAEGGDAAGVQTVSDAVNALAEAELDWPDIDAFEEIGLSIESAHLYTQVLHPES